MEKAQATKAYTKLHILALAVLSLLITWALLSQPAAGLTYSSGSYGTCQYNSCGITLTSSGSISLNVTPLSGSARCTVASDVVTVTTGSSTGYTVTLTDTDTTNTLTGTGSNITASSGTPASPVTLAANTWGYRVDGIASFGAGPASSVSNVATPSLTFAAVPLSSGTAGLIRTTNVVDTGTVNTSVWYGVCANSSLKSGSYTDSVTYTAVIN